MDDGHVTQLFRRGSDRAAAGTPRQRRSFLSASTKRSLVILLVLVAIFFLGFGIAIRFFRWDATAK